MSSLHLTCPEKCPPRCSTPIDCSSQHGRLSPPGKSTSRPSIRRARVGDGVDPAWMLERHLGLRGPSCRTPVSVHHVSRHLLATNASSSPEVDPTCEKKVWGRSGPEPAPGGRLYPTLGPLMAESSGSTNQV